MSGAGGGRGRRRLWVGALLLAAAAGAALLPSGWVEAAFARGWYPWWSRLLVPLSERARWPLTPLLALPALLLPLLLPLLLARRSRPQRTRGRQRGWRDAAATLWLLAGVAALAFQLGWGLNYRRPPAAELLALPARTHEALLPQLLATVERDLPSRPPSDAERDAALVAVAERLEALAAHTSDARVRVPRRLRTLPGGTLLTSGYSGIVSPFTLEAHFDGALPRWAQVAVGAHELAHVAGFAREADAELLGALAALTAADPLARYAAALGQFARALSQRPAAEREAWLARLPASARRDLERSAAAAARFRSGPLSHVVTRVYDRFLRSQGQSDGVAGYEAASALLARALTAGWWGDAAASREELP